jgi:hypothetical protein
MDILFEDRISKLPITDIKFNNSRYVRSTDEDITDGKDVNIMLAICSSEGKIWIHDMTHVRLVRTVTVNEKAATCLRLDFSLDSNFIRVWASPQDIKLTHTKPVDVCLYYSTDTLDKQAQEAMANVKWASNDCPFNLETRYKERLCNTFSKNPFFFGYIQLITCLIHIFCVLSFLLLPSICTPKRRMDGPCLCHGTLW